MATTVPTNGPSRLLTPAETADLLQISERTLENWRGRGHGPPHTRLTKRSIRYRERDVRSWIDAQLRASTAAQRPPVGVAS